MARLRQREVADRMNRLGFADWHTQTVGNIERGQRRVLVSELPGLALSFGSPIGRLIAGLDGLRGTPGPKKERAATEAQPEVVKITVKAEYDDGSSHEVEWDDLVDVKFGTAENGRLLTMTARRK